MPPSLLSLVISRFISVANRTNPRKWLYIVFSFLSVSSLDAPNNATDLDSSIDPMLLKMNDDEIQGTSNQCLFSIKINLYPRSNAFLADSQPLMPRNAGN